MRRRRIPSTPCHRTQLHSRVHNQDIVSVAHSAAMLMARLIGVMHRVVTLSFLVAVSFSQGYTSLNAFSPGSRKFRALRVRHSHLSISAIQYVATFPPTTENSGPPIPNTLSHWCWLACIAHFHTCPLQIACPIRSSHAPYPITVSVNLRASNVNHLTAAFSLDIGCTIRVRLASNLLLFIPSSSQFQCSR